MFNRLSWQPVRRLMSSRDCVKSLPVWLPTGRYPQGALGSQKVWEAREGPQESREREREVLGRPRPNCQREKQKHA